MSSLFGSSRASHGIVDKPLSRGKQEVSGGVCRRPLEPPRTPPPAPPSRSLLAQPACLLPLQVSLSTFAYLFSELVQYCQSRVSNIGELERK